MVLALAARSRWRAARNKVEVRTVGETEGLYIDVGELKYQVQISRIINPYDIEDRNYLRGLPAGTLPPKADEAWFGVWLRVQNTTSEKTFDDRRGVRDRRHAGEHGSSRSTSASRTTSSPTAPGRSGPTRSCRTRESPAGQGPVQGSLLLFKLTNETLQNRPLEFKITSPTDPDDVGIVDLDV